MHLHDFYPSCKNLSKTNVNKHKYAGMPTSTIERIGHCSKLQIVKMFFKETFFASLKHFIYYERKEYAKNQNV